MRSPALAVLAALSLPLCGAAKAEPFAVTSAINSGSFARAHALPLLGEGAVLALGQSAWRLDVNNANEFYDKGGALLLDAETLRLDFSARQALAQGWDWGLRLPLLVQGGGASDAFIENWHGFFGLPNGGRDLAPHNRYRIRYSPAGQTLLDLGDGHNGLGDVQATLGWQATPTLVLRGMLQLPTGQASTLSGGHGGWAVWGEWLPVLAALPSVRSDFAAGLSLSQTRGPLKSIQKPFALFGRAAVAVPLYGPVQGHINLQLHSALYDDTGQKPISGPGGGAAFGLGFAAWGCQFDLGVEEDILVNSAPDFALKLGMTYRPS